MTDADVDHLTTFGSVPRSHLSDLWDRFCNQQEHWDLDELCRRVEVRPEGRGVFHTLSERRLALREARPLKIIRFDLADWRAHSVQSAAKQQEIEDARARAQQDRDDLRQVADERQDQLEKDIKTERERDFIHRVAKLEEAVRETNGAVFLMRYLT